MALFGPATDDRDPSGVVRKLRAALGSGAGVDAPVGWAVD